MTTTANNHQYFEVMDDAELDEKQIFCTNLQGVALAMCRSKGQVYAINNLCTHAASTFDEGRVRGHFIVCPLHGVMFDMRSGEPNGTLAKKALLTYPTRLTEQGKIEVGLPIEA